MTKISQKLIQNLKSNLEKEKKSIETELKKFAEKNKNLEGDWNTRFPTSDGSEVGSAALEKAADEIEEYETLLSLEHKLEIHLQNINLALEKIKEGKYGICEKCKKPIEIKRLKVYPEARFCLKCEKLR
jgi:DnaK suppressor protein